MSIFSPSAKTKDKKAKEDKKPEWSFQAPKNNIKLAATAIEGNVLYSRTDVWAVYIIPNQSYEFLSNMARVRLAQQYNQMLENLITSSDKPVEAHQIVTSRPFDVLGWGRSLFNKAQAWNPSTYFGTHLWQMMHRVQDKDFSIKETFLLIHLGRRTKDYTTHATGKGVIQYAMRYLDKLSVVNDPLVSDEEKEYWEYKEKEYGNSITTSDVNGLRANATQIAWLVKKQMFPDMMVPEPSASEHESWGYGELQLLGVGNVSRKTRHLEITQFNPRTGEEVTGYRATLSFARFPGTMNFPESEPWIHSASSLPFDVDVHSRFTIEPALKVKKEMTRKIKDAQDQIANASGSGNSIPLDMVEQHEDATNLEHELNKERKPWVYARHRLVVEASDLETLHKRARMVVDHYKSVHSITVSWTSADQMELFLETQPGDKVRDTAFLQRHKIDIMGGGMPHGAGTVGDTVTEEGNGKRKGWIGPYLGFTTSRVEEPVFLSVHSAIAHNNAPGLAITGAPGGGKSFSAFTMTYNMSLEGVWTIYLDPKADAKPMKDLPGLTGAKVFDLREGNSGLLDPFSIGDTIPEKQLLALETVRLFTGELPNDQETALIKAIQKIVHAEDPSLSQIVDILTEDGVNDASEALGQKLRLIRDLPFANLCFSSQKVSQIRPDQGLTLITLLGLSLPSSEDKQEHYSYDNRLAVGVMYLLTSFTRKLMLSMNKRQPKAIIIDEAWAITSTPQGAKIVPEVARMGRSHNTALILVSQNAGDLLSEGITNSISIKMAYRANVVPEVEAILKFFDLEKDTSLMYTIQDLRNGECLIKDAKKRIARVMVDAWNEEMKTTFDTNPETRNDKNSGITQEATPA